MNAKKASLELAVIGNGQVAGLLDSAGRLVWACLPRPDSDPTMCALLTRAGSEAADGIFAIALSDQAQQQQRYLRNTAIVETRLTGAGGSEIRIIDFCPRFQQLGRMFRPMMFIRIVEPLHGRAHVRMRFKPSIDYGRRPAEITVGNHHLSFALVDQACRLTTDASLAALLEERVVVLDAPVAFLLGPDESVEQQPLSLAHSFLDQTQHYWQEWVRSLAVPADWQDAVIRSAITLKLCTFDDSGAVLSALTTSIPEAEHTVRNWDYRYCWLRDSYFVIQALNRLGATRTMEGFLRYIGNIVAQSTAGALQPLYGITGNPQLQERIVTTLDGYRGIGPVRVGNAAFEQRQHDVYGAVILAASQNFYDARLTAPGDIALFTQLEELGRHAAELFEQPDAGPWEYRGQEQVHTYPAVMCWAGCDRLARIARHLQLPERAQFWREHADAMRPRILQRAWNPRRNAIVDRFDGDQLDATALLLPELGFLPASDERFVATLAAIERELRVGDLVFRYRHDDDFGSPANAFTICSFWYVNALAAVGRTDEARAVFERLLGRRNALGLFSEDIDPVSGEHWGNYPQTYSMVGIIFSALRLSRSWDEIL
ncbi:MAG TPA: glycoside hydrolase family 15 protein [Steroidobacteraceae bacterium]|nr:glycoside hydrolase family 15 protein [Steroidobacteraceae bacterium]